MRRKHIDFIFCDNKTMEDVVEKFAFSLLRYCHNILCDYYEAQDAVQITFVKAYNKHAMFKADKELSSWIYRIAYNTCVDILRKRKLRQTISIPQHIEQDNLIPDNIKKALLSLSLLDRSLVYARVIEERSYNELAEIHHKSSASLRKRYERAKNKLANVLKDDYSLYAKQHESTIYARRS